MMNLYKIHRPGECGYDQAKGFVIQAENAQEARSIASSHCGDEGPGVWMDPNQSSIRSLARAVHIISSPKDAPDGIVLTDFHAG